MKRTSVSRKIAANIRSARKASGLTVADLARSLNVHRQQTANVEMGKTAVRVDTLLAYAKALNVPVASLLAGCE